MKTTANIAFVLLGLNNIARQLLEFYSALLIWQYKLKSYGQASCRNSIFPTAQMPGR
jgi:hypothetical protein